MPIGRLLKTGPRALVAALLVAAVVGVLAFTAFGAREGFDFEGRVSPMSEAHASFVRLKCGSGTTWTELISNPEWDYLGKYNRDEVKNACTGAMRAVQTVAASTSRDDMARLLESCKGEPCPSAGLRLTRPCANKSGTKCCAPNGTQCVDAKSASNLDKMRGKARRPKLGAEARAAQRSGTAKQVGGCYLNGEQIRDISIDWSTHGVADMTWACNAWEPRCQNRCKARKA